MLEYANLIGYWNSKYITGYIDPHKIVVRWEPELKSKVVSYLTSGKFYMGYMGWSDCRFCDEDVGATELTDGEWIWPYGLPHYINKHNIALPKEFLEHIQNNNFAIPEVVQNKLPSEDFWLKYCKSV